MMYYKQPSGIEKAVGKKADPQIKDLTLEECYLRDGMDLAVGSNIGDFVKTPDVARKSAVSEYFAKVSRRFFSYLNIKK